MKDYIYIYIERERGSGGMGGEHNDTALRTTAVVGR
jgi:hypothetical protein